MTRPNNTKNCRKQPVSTLALTIIALVMTAIGTLLPTQGAMAADMVVAQTGASISLEQILSGDRLLRQAACQNGDDQGLPQDHDCQICCIVPSLDKLAAPAHPLPDLTVTILAFHDISRNVGTALAPQAYHGRAPPV